MQTLFLNFADFSSAVICKKRFLMETKKCNILKTTNGIMLVRTILENPDKLLQGSWIGKIFEQPVWFQKPSNFRLLLTFKLVFICFTLTKIAKLQVLESAPKCPKTNHKWYLYGHPIRYKGPLFFFFYFFLTNAFIVK